MVKNKETVKYFMIMAINMMDNGLRIDFTEKENMYMLMDIMKGIF